MKQHDLIKLLKTEDFHIDPLGRVVIDNPEIIAEINGALNTNRVDDLLLNGGCSNSGCN